MPAVTAEADHRASAAATAERVVFYDGVCALCNRTVRFLLARDRRGVLRFAPLQGETFRELADRVAVPDDLGTIVYVRGHDTAEPAVHVRSDAIFRILHDLGGIWRVVSWLRIIPRPLRDAPYDWIARHRYKWFGKLDACRVPAAPDRERMLP